MNAIKQVMAVCSVATLAGCSAINPYQRSAALDRDLVLVDKDGSASCKEPQRRCDTPYGAGLGQALEDVNDQRLEWFGALSSHARTANLSSLAVYGLTAWGLYQGLKPGFTGGAADSGTKRKLAMAGIGAGSAYAVGNFFLNDKHDEAYVEGIKSLTCQMVRARPYLLSEAKYKELDGAVKDASIKGIEPANLAIGADSFGGPMGTAMGSSMTLSDQMEALDALTLHLRSTSGVKPKFSGNRAEHALAEADRALKLSRRTLISTRALKSRIDSLSHDLRRRGDLVVAAVSDELRRSSKGIAEPGKFLTDLRNVTGQFQAIPAVKEDDPAADPAATEGSGSGAADDGADKAAGPEAKVVKQATVAAEDAHKDVVALAAKLDTLIDAQRDAKLMKDVQVKKLNNDLQKTKKEFVAKSEEARKLDKKVEDLKAQLKEAGKSPITAKDHALLAAATARLYATRRDVNQFLVNHEDLAKRFKSIPECRGGPVSAMVLLPSEDMMVARGGNYRFQVSGAQGVPVASLQGNPGARKDGRPNMLVSIEGGVVVIDITIADDAPAGTLRLMVHDAATRAVEDVTLTIPAAKS
jgi:hypothetical protein